MQLFIHNTYVSLCFAITKTISYFVQTQIFQFVKHGYIHKLVHRYFIFFTHNIADEYGEKRYGLRFSDSMRCSRSCDANNDNGNEWWQGAWLYNDMPRKERDGVPYPSPNANGWFNDEQTTSYHLTNAGLLYWREDASLGLYGSTLMINFSRPCYQDVNSICDHLAKNTDGVV